MTAPLLTMFITSIVIAILGEGIILFGSRENRSIGWVMLITGFLGFLITFIGLVYK